MVLGKLPVPGRPTILVIVGQGPIALAVGAGGGCSDIFTVPYPFSPLSPSLGETARYRLKYCQGRLTQNNQQPTNDTAYSTVIIAAKLASVSVQTPIWQCWILLQGPIPSKHTRAVAELWTRSICLHILWAD